MDLGIYAWLRGSKYRLSFLKALSKGPMLPSELATRFKINRSSVSRTLSELENQALISKSKSSSRTIAYFATDKGRKLLKDISQVEINRKEGGLH